MPDEKEPKENEAKEKPFGGPGAKLGTGKAEGYGEAKHDYGKKEGAWGNEKSEHEGGEGGEGGKEHKTEKEIGIGPVYKKTFIDTEEDEEHQKKYSNKKGENDLNFYSGLNFKVAGEVGSASYDPDKKVAKATLVSAKAEFVALHAQVGIKVDVGKALGDKIKDLLFDKVQVPGPNPP